MFVSEDLLKLEWKRIFNTCWIYVGHSSELTSPGDFRTRQSRRTSDHLLPRPRRTSARDAQRLQPSRRDGVPGARGQRARLLLHVSRLDLKPDGSLHAVPGVEDYGPKFDREAHALKQVPRLESYRDFWFLNFDPDAPSLVDYLAGAKDYIDLVVDQSPSGQMEIISGTQEYDIKANWKLLVENSVDDYHIIATHTTWIQYMINSGVNMKRPRGQLLPSKGKGIDLGNGHLTTDNPNYRGRRWRRGSRSMARTRRTTSRNSAPSWSSASARRAPSASPTPTAIW